MPDNKDSEHEYDIEYLWSKLGLALPVVDGFASDIAFATRSYRKPRRVAKLPEKERKAIFRKLDKAVRTLQEVLSDLPPSMNYELHDVAMGNDPEDYFETSQPVEDDSIIFSDFFLERWKERLPDLQFLISEALEHHQQPRARPKQNEDLELAIKTLGEVFEHYSGRNPMETYRYDELDEDRPYKSNFFDFLYAVFWIDESHKFPTSHTIGNATLRAFGLKK